MYYPSSQIKTNLYTNGGEYVTKLNNEDYIGYYYETSNGKKYVGKTPTSKGQIELILPPLVSSEDITYDPQYVRIAGWENDPDPEIDAVVDPLLVNSLSMYNYANLQKWDFSGTLDLLQMLLPILYLHNMRYRTDSMSQTREKWLRSQKV